MVYKDPANLTNMTALIQYGKEISGGFLGSALFIIIYLLLFLGSKTVFSTGKSFPMACFVGGVITLFFYFAGIFNDWHFYISMGLAALSIVMMFFD